MSQFQPPNEPQQGYSQQPQQYPPQYPQQPYPPQQQYQQQPMYQQPMQPPKKRHTARNIGCGVVAAVVVLVVILIAASSHGNTPTASTNNSSSSTSTANSPSSSSAPTGKIGNPITSGTWTATVNKVSTSTGDGEVNVPRSGDIYLVINITLKNDDSSAQTASTILQWKLQDAQGQSYDEDITYGGSSPDGAVVAGKQLRGNIAFEVPKSLHSFTLQFEPSLDPSQIVQWSISD